MNARFLIPSVVALTFHALVFLGLGRGHPPVPGLDTPVVISDPVLAIDVPLDVSERSDEPATEQKGNPAEALPVLPEPPTPDVTPDITIPREPMRPVNIPSDVKIIPGPIGRPDGLDRGGSPGPEIVGSIHLDNPPRTRTQLAPVYPYEARKDGRAGEVVVEFTVDESGRVLDPHVLRSNDPLFEQPTLRAISKWRFEPGRKNGRVVRFRMAVPVAFAVNQ